MLWNPLAFHELYQDAHTYSHALSTSRIDRISSNHHPAEQLAFDFYSHRAPLPRPREGGFQTL